MATKETYQSMELGCGEGKRFQMNGNSITHMIISNLSNLTTRKKRIEK
jgi:hypothetical protein